MMRIDQPPPVDVLILGLGWTSTFLLPLLDSHAPPLTHAGTTRDGRDGSVPFTFDPEDSKGAFTQLLKVPFAKTIVITFPIKGGPAMQTFLDAYSASHSDHSYQPNIILLGATSIWKSNGYNDEASPYDSSNERAQAEDYLLEHRGDKAVVLDLAGLYGGQRHPKSWLARVAKTKEQVKAKGAVHLVHGEDVARGVVLSIDQQESVGGKRWILTDGWSYDWWGLFVAYGREARELAGEEGEGLRFEEWIFELMEEGEGDGEVRGLPRDKSHLGRLMDGRAFWKAVGSVPRVGRLV